MLKRIGLSLCIFILAISMHGYAASITVDAGETITLHNASSWYIAEDNWLKSTHATEADDLGNLFISIDDFRMIFRCNIAYNPDDLSIYTQHRGRTIWQGLNTPVMFVDGNPYPNPAPYISSESESVMIPAEPYASVFGYQGKYEVTPDYLPGKLTLTLPPHEYKISKIFVNKEMQLVTVFGTDAAGTTMPLRYFVCSTGNPLDLTINGTFSANPLQYSNAHGPWYYFALHDCWVLYCTQLNGNICFHSIPFDQLGTSTLSQSGYHAIGTAASHGCIRLAIEDARFIWENCKNVPVEISDGFYDTTLHEIKKGILNNRPSYTNYVSSLKGNY